MEVIEKRLRVYLEPDGRAPFAEWIRSLHDRVIRQKIQARLARVRLGNLGTVRPVGEGVTEFIIAYGPGYRLYFGQDGEKIIILLVGGDKKSQQRDIKRAKEYWHDYKKEKKTIDY